MKEFVLKYLNKQYKFTLSTYVSYNLYDKIENKSIPLKKALNDIQKIFGITEDELLLILDEWADEQQTKLQNQITDIRYKLYEKTGVELDLTTNDLNKLLEESGEW